MQKMQFSGQDGYINKILGGEGDLTGAENIMGLDGE